MSRGGSNRPTMDDVARTAGVSRALVSMALRNNPRVRPETRDRILATAAEMGYRLNQAAATLASSSPTSLGVFLLDLRQDVYADMFDGIREVTDTEGKRLVLSVGSEDGSRDQEATESLVQSRVGIILATGLLMPDEQVRQLSTQIPVVSVARRIEGIDSVISDNRHGARLAMDHLCSLGHRRIVFLANPPTDGYLERRQGYQQYMTEAGLDPWVVESHYSRTKAAEDCREMLRLPEGQRPTAIFAHNDQAAIGALDAIAEAGLSAPADVSVIGYDNSRIGQGPGTKLTTVDIHGHQLGRDAARLALTRLAEPTAPARTMTCAPTLVIRATTGPCTSR